MGVFRSGAVPPQMRAGPGGTGGTGSEPGLRTGYWDGVPVPPGAAPSPAYSPGLMFPGSLGARRV